MLEKYFDLLRYNHLLAKLSLVWLIFHFSSWFSYTGIFTMLIELNAPAWAISISAAMIFIPSVLLAPFNGVIIDKLPKKALMLFLIISESLSVLLLVFISDLSYIALFFLLIFVRFGAGALYFQTQMSLLPSLLSKAYLEIANEIHSITFSFSYACGIALAGIFIYFFGLKAGFLFDFGLYCVAILLLYSSKISEPKLENKEVKIKKMLIDTFIYLKQNPLVLHLMLLHAFVAVFSFDSIVALLVNSEYKSSFSISLSIGFINMSMALGLIIGPVLLRAFVNEKNIFYFFIFQGLGVILWAFLQSNFYLCLFGMFCASFFCNSIWSYTMTKLQNACKSAFYGRVLAYNDMLYFLSSSLITGFVGLFYELGFGLFSITCVLGVLLVFGGFYWSFVSKKYLIKEGK